MPFPTSGDLPDPGIEPTSLLSPALAGGFFTTSTTNDGTDALHLMHMEKRMKICIHSLIPDLVILKCEQHMVVSDGMCLSFPFLK